MPAQQYRLETLGTALTAHLTMVRAPQTLPTLPAGPRRARWTAWSPSGLPRT
jgi:hypothetical protein